MKPHQSHRGSGRRVFSAIALVVAAVLAVPALAGCENDVSGAAAAAEVDVRQFQVGNFPTDPLDLRMRYWHDSVEGRELAVTRLADAVITGSEVDPKFDRNLRADKYLGSTPWLAEPVQPVVKANGMLFGFATSVSDRPLGKLRDTAEIYTYALFGSAAPDPDASSFNVTVLQFPDQQRAETAAEQMEAADFSVAPDQNVHVTLDRHPNATAHWRPGLPAMVVTVADGPYVVNVFTALPTPDLDGLRALSDKVLDAELPLLDRTPGLSIPDVFRLDYDPDSMLQRTLHPMDFIGPDVQTEATHTPRGFLHFVANAGLWQPLLDSAGVDRISTAHKGALLLRARDAAAATTLWNGINGLPGKPAETPEHVPDVYCAQNGARRTDSWSGFESWYEDDAYVCDIRYGRYVARVASAQLTDAQQRAAAQYALLANSQWM
ncbi:hypothetical protein [Nocardia sp. NBC_00511]|uniref:DUF7373 family lipoprotein n=1 Tax=Nocardia sp. NBC_00511 TaxID=2903591 RepID=UPI0030E1409B